MADSFHGEDAEQPMAKEHSSAVRNTRFLETDEVWGLLRQLAQLARLGQPVSGPASFTWMADQHWWIRDQRGLRNALPARLRPQVGSHAAESDVELHPDETWTLNRNASSKAHRLLDLYLPLCVGAGSDDLWLGHIGQSLDGFIATTTGESQFITGSENVEHMHRLRALFDAVVVGRATVTHDDPQLTTRLVEGPSPIRVVIDPQRRLESHYRLFHEPGPGTFIVCRLDSETPERVGHATCIRVTEQTGQLEPLAIREALAEHGLRRVFVEGGGSTVSRFLCAGVLDRLHLTVAPVLLGEGQRGLVAPQAAKLDDAWRLRHRRFVQGDDILFDCQLDDAPIRHS